MSKSSSVKGSEPRALYEAGFQVTEATLGFHGLRVIHLSLVNPEQERFEKIDHPTLLMMNISGFWVFEYCFSDYIQNTVSNKKNGNMTRIPTAWWKGCKPCRGRIAHIVGWICQAPMTLINTSFVCALQSGNQNGMMVMWLLDASPGFIQMWSLHGRAKSSNTHIITCQARRWLTLQNNGVYSPTVSSPCCESSRAWSLVQILPHRPGWDNV